MVDRGSAEMTKSELESLQPGDKVKGPSGFVWTVIRVELKKKHGETRAFVHLYVTKSKITPENCGEWVKLEEGQ